MKKYLPIFFFFLILNHAQSQFTSGTNTWTSYSNFTLGSGSYSSGYGAIAFGYQSTAYSGVGIGYSSYANGSGSVSIGYSNYSYGSGTTSLGYDNTAQSSYSTSIGYSNYVSSATGGVAIGYDNDTRNSYGISIGYSNFVNGTGAAALGYDNSVSGAYAVALGRSNSASGYYSTAMGYDTTVSDYASTVIGQYNSSGSSATSSSSFSTSAPAFVIGNGTSSGSLSDAFKVMFSGDTYVSGSLYIGGTEITSTASELNLLDGVTTIGDGILASVTESSNTGVRLSTSNASNHGEIGDAAVDLSKQGASSTTRGATGYGSLASGYNTTASESYSTALGSYTVASGYGSTALGRLTTASGYYSTAMGRYTTASDYASVVIGRYNSSSSSATSADNFSTSNPAFVIGNGTASNAKSDAFKVMFNGDAYISSSLYLGGTAVTSTAAEINYVDGVTSNVQTQLDSKQATITGAATTIASSDLTASRALTSNSSGKVEVSAVTSTELGYLDGVSSNIQNQLNAISSSADINGGAIDGAAIGANSPSTAVFTTVNSTGATTLASGGGVVNIASTGEMTTVKGTLNVDEAVTLDNTLDVTGDTSVSTFDSTGATTLASGGGVVNVASSGVMTTVKGTLNVDEAVTLDTTLDVSGALSIGGTTVTSTAAELNYVDGVTSNVQTQLDSKLSSSGNITTGGNIIIPDSGNIGSTSDTDAITIANSGNVTFGQDVTVNGDLVISSDERLKSNIVSLGSTLSKLLLIDGKSYEMKGKQKIGVLAQEIQEVFPELVSEDDNEMLAVNYQGLLPVLINALKEQDEKINRLEILVETLIKNE